MNLKICFVLAIAALIFVAGCKKEPVDSVDPSQLTGKSWKQLTDDVMPPVDYNYDGTFETDIFVLYKDCRQNDTYVFSAGGVITRDEGPSVCVWSDPHIRTGTWSWDAGQTQLTISIDSSTRIYSVIKLTSDVLKMQHPDTIFSKATLSTQIFGIL